MMRKLGYLLGFLLLLVTMTVFVTNTPFGRTQLAQLCNTLSGDKVRVSGINGHFPDALTIERIEIADPVGTWLVIQQLQLDWSPMQLLHATADIDTLAAKTIAVIRLPESTEPTNDKPFSLPVKINLHTLHLEQINLAAPIIGVASQVRVEGGLQLSALDRGTVNIVLQRLDQAGDYRLQGRFNDVLDVHLTVHEPTGGLLSGLLKTPTLGAIDINASLQGTPSKTDTHITVQAGLLQGEIVGLVNLAERQADLAINANSTAMQLQSQVGWQALALHAKFQGTLTKPSINGEFTLDALTANGLAIKKIVVQSQADSQVAQFRAELHELSVPNLPAEFTKNTPLILTATAQLADPNYPIAFSLQHDLINAKGKAQLAGDQLADLVLNLPHIKPLAAAANLAADGSITLAVRSQRKNQLTQVDVQANLGISSKNPQWTNLMGNAAKLNALVSFDDQNSQLSKFLLEGKAVKFAADGDYRAQHLKLNWRSILANLTAISPNMSGHLDVQGQVTGLLTKLAATAELKGEFATKGVAKAPVNASLQVQDLPNAPAGKLTLQGIYAKAPVNLLITGKQLADQQLQLSIEKADWKTAHVTGLLKFAKASPLPTGDVDLKMTRLADLQTVLGQALTGSLTAHLKTTPKASDVQVVMQNFGFNDIRVEQSRLKLVLTDVLATPNSNGTLQLDGISTDPINGNARVDFAGTLDALTLNLVSALNNQTEPLAKLTAKAELKTSASRLKIVDLQAENADDTLRLLTPTELNFANGLTIESTRLGWQDATLELGGRISPNLALQIAVRQLPANLVHRFVPELTATGVLQADATLSGSFAKPYGKVTVNADKIRLRKNNTPLLAPIDLNGLADLQGDSASVAIKLSAGTLVKQQLTGRIPLNATAALALHSQGNLNLSISDALLSAGGQRLRGQVDFNADVTGSFAEPLAQFNVLLSQGEFMDYALGVRINEIKGELKSKDAFSESLHLEGRSGKGTIAINGTTQLLADGLPIALQLQARNARPLSSDQLTVLLDSNLALKGQATNELTVSGDINIRRAESAYPINCLLALACLTCGNTVRRHLK